MDEDEESDDASAPLPPSAVPANAFLMAGPRDHPRHRRRRTPSSFVGPLLLSPAGGTNNPLSIRRPLLPPPRPTPARSETPQKGLPRTPPSPSPANASQQLPPRQPRPNPPPSTAPPRLSLPSPSNPPDLPPPLPLLPPLRQASKSPSSDSSLMVRSRPSHPLRRVPLSTSTP